MNKEEFDAMLGRLRAALEEADRLMVEAKAEHAKAVAHFNEAKRVYGGHLSWGKAVGYVEAPDVLDEIINYLSDGGDVTRDVLVARLGASGRAVAGALRRGVNKGLLVKSEDGFYARA